MITQYLGSYTPDLTREQYPPVARYSYYGHNKWICGAVWSCTSTDVCVGTAACPGAADFRQCAPQAKIADLYPLKKKSFLYCKFEDFLTIWWKAPF
jgi:hypothetical protein